MTKQKTRAAFLMLATAWLITFIAFTPIAARADAPAVLTRAASLYARPSSKSTIVTKLEKGDLTVLRATSGAWSKVLYKGKTAYLARKAIRRQSAKRLYAAEDVNLLDEAAASGKAIIKIGSGDVVYAVSSKEDWYKALYKGYTGYVPKSALGNKKPSPTPKPTNTPKPTAAPTPAPEEAYTTKQLKLYKGASSSTQIGTVPAGAEVVRYYYNNKTWAKVSYKGKKGYLSAKYLTAEPPAPTPSPKPTPTAKPTPTIKPTPTAKPVATPTPAPQAAFATKQLKLYKGASTSSQVGTVPKGAEVLRYYYNNKSWARVIYNGRKGYVAAQYLSEVPAATPAPTPTPSPTPTPKPTPTPSPTPKPTPTPAPESDDGQLEPGDTGDAVKKLQTRLKALGWFSGVIGGNYLTLTTQAVKDFQSEAGLEASGIATAATQKKLFASDAPKREKPETNSGESTASPASGSVKGMDWWTSNIQKIFYRGRTVAVTDVRTGLSWKEVRVGGTNHADTVPLADQDTAVLKAAYGGKWSWVRRPIWVSIDGVRYAASMNGMPHGGNARDNGFPGHHCIHFTNSRTHGTNNLDPDHQAAIREALAEQ